MATSALNTEIDTAAASVDPSLEQLSFTGRRADGGITLWKPLEGGANWADECRLGRERAVEAVDYIRASANCAMLPGIVRAIAEQGEVGGVEVGFFTGVSALIARGA